MKLRNKKTGEITEAISIHDGFICVDWKGDSGIYSTLASLNKEFEDYKPAEPLIKDEKIRKAVRAWAEAIKENTIRFDRVSQGFSFGDGNVYSSINFDGFVFDLVDGKKYTIAELCEKEKE